MAIICSIHDVSTRSLRRSYQRESSRSKLWDIGAFNKKKGNASAKALEREIMVYWSRTIGDGIAEG